MNVAIYEYRDPRRFLLDRFNAIKKKNSRYSLRGFAKLLGLSSHSGLVQFINGDRSLSKKCIEPIAQALKLNNLEKEYFTLIVELSKTQSEDNVKLEDRLKVISLKATTEISSNGVDELLRNPLNFYLLEMADAEPLSSDVKKIKKRLKIRFTEKEIQETLKLLFHIGFLRFDINGDYVRDKSRFLMGGGENTVKSGIKYHQEILKHAGEALLINQSHEREFNGVVLNVDGGKLSEMKKDIKDFIMEFILKYDQPNAENCKTYQLNQQLFLISEK